MKKMTKICTVLITLLGFTVVNAQDFKKVQGFNHIESVVSDGEYLYVADIGLTLKPFDKDGDGKIIQLDKDGKVINPNFIRETLNAPKGLAIEENTLFVNDVDKLLAFDLKTGNKLYEIDFSAQSYFLNDIAIWDKNTLYVSASDTNKIYKVNLTTKTFEPFTMDKEIPGANGLFVDKSANRLYVNGFGTNGNSNGLVGYVDLKTNKFTQITPIEGYYDGIYLYDGMLYFTNWMDFDKKGIIGTMSLQDGKISVLKVPELINGPADFTIFRNRLVVPGMMDGSLNFITLKKEALYIH